MPTAQPQAQPPLEDLVQERPETQPQQTQDPAAAGTAESSLEDQAARMRDGTWQSHPIDIRISIPLPFGRWYFTLVGGPERRSRTRRAEERRKHPLLRLGNIVLLFLLGSAVGFGLAGLMINLALAFLDSPYTIIGP